MEKKLNSSQNTHFPAFLQKKIQQIKENYEFSLRYIPKNLLFLPKTKNSRIFLNTQAKRLNFRHSQSALKHNGPICGNKRSCSVGIKGTTITSGTIRVQQHQSQVSVSWGIFHLVIVTSYRVKFLPMQRDLGVVSFDSF